MKHIVNYFKYFFKERPSINIDSSERFTKELAQKCIYVIEEGGSIYQDGILVVPSLDLYL